MNTVNVLTHTTWSFSSSSSFASVQMEPKTTVKLPSVELSVTQLWAMTTDSRFSPHPPHQQGKTQSSGDTTNMHCCSLITKGGQTAVRFESLFSTAVFQDHDYWQIIRSHTVASRLLSAALSCIFHRSCISRLRKCQFPLDFCRKKITL